MYDFLSSAEHKKKKKKKRKLGHKVKVNWVHCLTYIVCTKLTLKYYILFSLKEKKVTGLGIT